MESDHRHEKQKFSEVRTQILILGQQALAFSISLYTLNGTYSQSSTAFFSFSETLAWTSIFPYAIFMVQSFGKQSEAHAALLVGLLISIWTFGEFLGGTLWSRLSDKIGRKPTLLIGGVAAMISAALYGLSKSIYAAVAVRAAGGLMNPNVAVVPTCIGELVKNKSHRAKAFSMVPFLEGFGSVIGPVVGGFFAEPVKRFPSVFHQDSIWDHYPFLLPNLIVLISQTTSLTMGLMFLRETHTQHTQNPKHRRNIVSHLMTNLKQIFLAERTTGYTIIENDTDEGGLSFASPSRMLTSEMSNAELQMNPLSNENHERGSLHSPSKESRTPYNTQVVLQIWSIFLLAFHKVASDTLIPAFLANPTPATEMPSRKDRSIFRFNGGFGMNTATIGNVLLSQAIVAIIAQLVAVPSIIKRYGALQTCRWTFFAFPWLYCLTPFVVRFPWPLSVIALLLDLWIKVVLVALGSVASNILITDIVTSPENLATVNGAAASFACLARSIGPLVTGSLFDWSRRRTVVGLPFWILSGVSAIAAVEAWLLTDYPCVR